MRTIVVISECLDERPGRVNFHFKGQLEGQFVEALKLTSESSVQWKEGEEYVLYVAVESVAQGVLHGKVLRSRNLDELLD